MSQFGLLEQGLAAFVTVLWGELSHFPGAAKLEAAALGPQLASV